jgi:Glycosyl hydrolases family 18
MKKLPVFILAFVLVSTSAFAQRKYVGWSSGYLPNYENFSVSKINWKCYTHVFWFSISPNRSGVVGGLSATTAKNFTTACHQNNTKAIICVGGAGYADSFETATANSTILNTFVNSMVTFMQQNSFDGIDIDWEDDGQGITASKYLALFQGLNAALLKITPKPLLTAAVADYYSTQSAPVYPYCDQMNIMSYYDNVNSSPQEVSEFTSKGVPKSKLGIGYGYEKESPPEVDGPNEAGNGPNGNLTDINAKCLYSINNGCGGIMIWALGVAPAACDSVTAYYVNKNATGIHPFYADYEASDNSLVVKRNKNTGISEIWYTTNAGSAVDLSVFDVNGALVRTLVGGISNPGPHVISLQQNSTSMNSGVYIFKLKTNSRTAATKAFIVK